MRVWLGTLGAGKFFLLAIAVFLAIVPTLIAVNAVIQPPEALVGAQSVFPKAFSLESVVNAFTDPKVLGWVRNSAIIALGTAGLTLAIGIPAAFVLARREFPGRRGFLITILVTQTVAPAVLIVPLFRMMANFKVLDTHLSVIVVSTAFVLPFSIWLMTGFFGEALSREIEEASELDGATSFRFLWTILIPNSLPGLTATAIWAFMYGWNDYIFSLTFLTNPDLWPLAIGTASSVGLWGIDWGALMAASLIGTIPILTMFVLLRRPLESGLNLTTH